MNVLSQQAEIERAFPAKMLCTNGFEYGSFYRVKSEAITMRYVGPNCKNQSRFILVDCDREGGEFAALDAGLKLPTWVAISPDSGHCHLGWQLKNPVTVSDRARSKPIEYLAATREALTQAIGGDLAYNGRLTQNPLSEYWQVITSGKCANGESYSMAELCELDDGHILDLNAARRRLQRKAPKLAQASEGRNCSLFETLRTWSYREIRNFWRPGGQADWGEFLGKQASRLNGEFSEPLSSQETRAVVRSVAGWTWRNITPQKFEDFKRRTHTSEVQRKRAIKKGEQVRLEGLELLRQGKSKADVAVELAVSLRTVERWKSL